MMTEPRPTILVVEDEEAIRRIAVRVLQRAGFECLQAGDGEEGLALSRQHGGSISLIVTDVKMPKLDGWSMVQAIRAGGSDLPVLLTSGLDAAQVSPTPLPERVQVIEKPWDPTTLVAAVKRSLG
jgi:two-component system cell cycle sensor histidine kinase/response regulator CckA